MSSEYGHSQHISTGFIIAHSSQSESNIIHILTDANAVIYWENNRKIECDSVTFHISQNRDVKYRKDRHITLSTKELARFRAIHWIIHPKYLENKSEYYNIAIVQICDKNNEFRNVKPLKLAQTTKNCDYYKRAKVFGYAGIYRMFFLIKLLKKQKHKKHMFLICVCVRE